jgi:hypothetical protein
VFDIANGSNLTCGWRGFSSILEEKRKLVILEENEDEEDDE